MKQTEKKSIKELLEMSSEEVLEYVLSLPAEEQKPLREELLQAQAEKKLAQENLSAEIHKDFGELPSLQKILDVANKHDLKLVSIKFPKAPD